MTDEGDDSIMSSVIVSKYWESRHQTRVKQNLRNSSILFFFSFDFQEITLIHCLSTLHLTSFHLCHREAANFDSVNN